MNIVLPAFAMILNAEPGSSFILHPSSFIVPGAP